MAKKPGSRSEFVFFNVLYENGTQRSNRRVPSDIASGAEGEAAARAFIEQQDREIAEKSGLPALPIKSLSKASR
jgi:hypothetical protein